MIDDMKAAAERLRGAPVAPVPAGRMLDVVALWPELFEGFDERERNAIRQAFDVDGAFVGVPGSIWHIELDIHITQTTVGAR